VFSTPCAPRSPVTARFFRGATRDAIVLRDRWCTYVSPNGVRCRVPADECEVDHEIPVEEGGETTQENGRLRCPRHHSDRQRFQPWLEAERAARRAARRARPAAPAEQPATSDLPGDDVTAADAAPADTEATTTTVAETRWPGGHERPVAAGPTGGTHPRSTGEATGSGATGPTAATGGADRVDEPP
jgi:hypothetical protein